MGVLISLVLFLAIISASDAAWCVCRSDVSSSAQQKALDYACGAGADCSPIIQSAACYNPNSVQAHCSYAVNSYYQRKGQSPQACNFSGAATTTTSDPSISGCTYPSSSSAAGTESSTTPGSSTTPSTSTPGSSGTGTGTGTSTPTTNPGSLTTPTGSTPSSFTPTTGTGGVLGGLGPSGMSTDTSDGGRLTKAGMGSLLFTIFVSVMVSLRG